MAASAPPPLLAPRPKRTAILTNIQTPKNLFKNATDAPQNDEGAKIAAEIRVIAETYPRCSRSLVMGGNKTSPTYGRRSNVVDKQPPRTTTNPMLTDQAFTEIEKSGTNFPWDSPLASPQL